MGTLEWKAEQYDRIMAVIDEGKPVWEWDNPAVIDNRVRLSMYNNVTGEIRMLFLEMSDLVQLNKTGAFDKHGDTYEEDRKRFDAFVESIPGDED